MVNLSDSWDVRELELWPGSLTSEPLPWTIRLYRKRDEICLFENGKGTASMWWIQVETQSAIFSSFSYSVMPFWHAQLQPPLRSFSFWITLFFPVHTGLDLIVLHPHRSRRSSSSGKWPGNCLNTSEILISASDCCHLASINTLFLYRTSYSGHPFYIMTFFK